MTGRRLSGQIRSLQNLNNKLKLGYTDKEISELSSGQLRKMIGDIKTANGIKIPDHSKYKSKNRRFQIE